jgi:hypothetical protein
MLLPDDATNEVVGYLGDDPGDLVEIPAPAASRSSRGCSSTRAART